MKKFLSSILVIILFIALMGVNVFAANNGPVPPMDMGGGEYWDAAFIMFYENKEDGIYKYAYSQGKVKNEMQGASYDKTSNTLTFTNLNTEMLLSVNAMGDDFKIKLVGNNKIGHIVIWGWGWGGTLTFTGDGTLTVNPDKLYDEAIKLNAESAAAALKVGEEATLNLYAKGDVAVINQTTINTTANAIVFANGQTANITKEVFNYEEPKRIIGYDIKYHSELERVTHPTDTTGIYGRAHRDKYIDGEGWVDGYYIYKLVYDADLDFYISTSLDEYAFIKYSDFDSSGYTLVLDETIDAYTYYDEYNVYVDSNNKQYAVYETIYVHNDDTQEVIKEVKNIETNNSNPEAYIFTDNNTVSVDSLTQVIETIYEEGFYIYTLKGSSFNYKPGKVHTHTFDGGVVNKKATFTADGVKTYTCTSKDATKTEAIAKVSNVKLDKTSYTYDGKAKKPTVTVKDSKGKVLKNGTDYTVSYPSGRKNVGKYKVKVTLKGNYTGSKDLEFTIKPKGTSLSKLTAGKKQFNAIWKAQKTQTTGYEVQYSTNKNFKNGNKTVNIKKNKTTSETVKKLKAKKKYFVRIRTYKTISGKKIYSDWSKSKNVTTKK